MRRKKVLLLLSRVMTELHHGAALYAKERNWHLTSNLIFDSAMLKSWRGDGVICTLGSDEKLIQQALSYGVPLVDLVGTRLEINISRILPDEEEICQLAAEHFRERGYRNIAFWGHPGWPAEKRRRETFSKLINRDDYWNGLTILNDHPASNRLSLEGLTDYIVQQIDKLPKPCAIFCFNDTCATEVVEACLNHNIKIPQEVAILGVNDNDLLRDFSPIPLSSINTRMRQRAYLGAKALDELMQNSELQPHTQYIKPAGIICRQSSDFTISTHPAVQEALDFIRRNVEQPLNVDNVVQNGNLSRRGLEKAFEKHLNRSILYSIQLCKMTLAKNLLLSSSLNLVQIQKACGFSYPQPFYRTFFKLEKCSPKEFKEKNFIL